MIEHEEITYESPEHNNDSDSGNVDDDFLYQDPFGGVLPGEEYGGIGDEPSVSEDDVYGYYTESDYVYDCYIKPYLEGRQAVYTESDYFYEYYTQPLLEEAESVLRSERRKYD